MAAQVGSVSWSQWCFSSVESTSLSMLRTVCFLGDSVLGKNGTLGLLFVGGGFVTTVVGARKGGGSGQTMAAAGTMAACLGTDLLRKNYNNREQARLNKEFETQLGKLTGQVTGFQESLAVFQGLSAQELAERREELRKITATYQQVQGEVSALKGVKIDLRSSVDELRGRLVTISGEMLRLEQVATRLETMEEKNGSKSEKWK